MCEIFLQKERKGCYTRNMPDEGKERERLKNDELQRTCCFTGHRPGHGGIRYLEGEAGYEALLDVLDRAIIEVCEQFDIRIFLCGMADGFDLVAGKRVLALKRTQRIPKEVKLIAVQPFPEHIRTIGGMRWQQDYDEVLQCADDVCVVTNGFSIGSYHKRNAFMVQRSCCVIAFWNGARRSGSGQTVRLAEKQNRMVINLYGI